MEGLKPILERRSYRVYKDEPVSEQVIETLLRAGMYAPSAMNSQPWEFLVMQDEGKKEQVSMLRPYWSMLKKSPLGILVMADTNGYRSSTKEFFIQDCAAATQNILLAAQAQGLGGVWLGMYPIEDVMQRMREIYSIPDHIIPFSVVSVGYPDKPLNPHRTYNDQKVHRDEY